MDKHKQDYFVSLLKKELIPAMGCTEPIAIAYAAALGRRILGGMPDAVEGYMSGNIVKNVKCVIVPNSGGRSGMNVAVALGLAAGDDSLALEVISRATDEQREEMRRILEKNIIQIHLSNSVIPLDILLLLRRGADTVTVRIADTHLNVVHLQRNDEILIHKELDDTSLPVISEVIMVEDILQFAAECPLEPVEELLETQIRCNTAIAEEGLRNPWGSCVGQTMVESDTSLRTRAAAAAAAGSDARMNGCELPVVINSGSGNQGLTVSLPLIVYAKEMHSSHEDLLRALIVSNLMAICQKKQIGSLSAYCGAVSAAAAAAAGLARLMGESDRVVMESYSNALDMASGIVCDGASASCSGKIATGIYAGMLGIDMAKKKRSFNPADGIVGQTTNDTIAHVGTIARVGMKETDREILHIMLKN